MSARSGALCIAVVCCGLLAACGGAQSRLESHLKRGQDYFAKGNYGKASVEFRDAMQIAPKDAKARLLAGRAAEHLGRTREAWGLYQSVVDSQPQNTEANAALARLMLYSGAVAPAMKIIRTSLAQHPDDPELLTLSAAGKITLKDFDGASADIERALRLAPSNVDAIEVRTGLYQQSGDLPKAIDYMADAVKRVPASRPLREVLVNLEVQAERPAQAERELQKLIELAPQETRYRYQLAGEYSKTHDLDNAQRVLEDAVRAIPDQADVKLTLVDFISTQRTRAQGEQVLRSFIARDPKDYNLKLSLGALLRRSGDAKAAIGVYSAIIRDDELEPPALIARGRLAAIYLSQGQYEDTRKLLQEVLGKNPRDSTALLLRGEMAQGLNDPAAAIVDFRAVLQDQPKLLDVRRRIAQAYAANGEFALAEESLRGALDLAPGDITLSIDLAKLLEQTQRPDAAVALLEKSVLAAPDNAVLRDELARAYLAKGDYPAAHTAAEALQTMRPKLSEGYYVAGMVDEAQKKFDAAEREFEQALSVQPQVLDVLSALARLEVARGKAAKAVELVRKASEQPPPNAFTLNLLGELYLTQKNASAAEEVLTRAIKLSPQWWVPYRTLAAARFTQKDPAGAITAYQSAIKVAPTQTQLVEELATIYEKQGRLDEAISCYESSYRSNPKASQLANNLAMLLVTYKTDQASLDRARDLTAAFATSANGNFLDTNGWVHFKRAEYSLALPVLEHAVKQSPDSKEIRYHLGVTEAHAGLTDRARDDLQSALSGAASFSGSEDARAALAALKSRAG